MITIDFGLPDSLIRIPWKRRIAIGCRNLRNLYPVRGKGRQKMRFQSYLTVGIYDIIIIIIVM